MLGYLHSQPLAELKLPNSTLVSNGDHIQDTKDFWTNLDPGYSRGITYSSTEGARHSSYSLSWPMSFTYNNGTVFDEEFITHTGRCIAESDEAYSWGFSSLLLLTFCCCTIFFSSILILLQSDVYWHSRSDRGYESPSIYGDVIYLAKKLQKMVGHDLQSPRAVDEQVRKWKRGLRCEVHETSLSSLQERRNGKTQDGRKVKEGLAWRYRGRAERAIRQQMRQCREDYGEDAMSESQNHLEHSETAHSDSSAPL